MLTKCPFDNFNDKYEHEGNFDVFTDRQKCKLIGTKDTRISLGFHIHFLLPDHGMMMINR